MSGSGVKLDGSLQPLDKLGAEAEAKARPLLAPGTGLAEVIFPFLEGTDPLGLDADPVVLHGETDALVRFRDHHLDLAGMGGELDRVVDQVADQEGDHLAVGDQLG